MPKRAELCLKRETVNTILLQYFDTLQTIIKN